MLTSVIRLLWPWPIIRHLLGYLALIFYRTFWYSSLLISEWETGEHICHDGQNGVSYQETKQRTCPFKNNFLYEYRPINHYITWPILFWEFPVAGWSWHKCLQTTLPLQIPSTQTLSHPFSHVLSFSFLQQWLSSIKLYHRLNHDATLQ